MDSFYASPHWGKEVLNILQFLLVVILKCSNQMTSQFRFGLVKEIEFMNFYSNTSLRFCGSF